MRFLRLKCIDGDTPSMDHTQMITSCPYYAHRRQYKGAATGTRWWRWRYYHGVGSHGALRDLQCSPPAGRLSKEGDDGARFVAGIETDPLKQPT